MDEQAAARLTSNLKRIGKLIQFNRGGFCLIQDAKDRHGFHFWLRDVPGYQEGKKPEDLGLRVGGLVEFLADYTSDGALAVKAINDSRE